MSNPPSDSRVGMLIAAGTAGAALIAASAVIDDLPLRIRALANSYPPPSVIQARPSQKLQSGRPITLVIIVQNPSHEAVILTAARFVNYETMAAEPAASPSGQLKPEGAYAIEGGEPCEQPASVEFVHGFRVPPKETASFTLKLGTLPEDSFGCIGMVSVSSNHGTSKEVAVALRPPPPTPAPPTRGR